MVFFALNCHVTPIGLVGINKKQKTETNTRQLVLTQTTRFSGINDWTTMETEPPLHFATSFMNYLKWIYNLRVTYPKKEIYLGDDDISGAFRHMKYNPNLVGMRLCVIAGHLASSTGTTFGDNTSPLNFEPIADARWQLAQYLWKQSNTISQTTKFLPAIQLAAPPSADDIQSFVRADANSINRGVTDNNSNQMAPQFDHHVDDNIYADVGEYMHRRVCLSVLALWQILGLPNKERPNPLRRKKFCGTYTHLRKTLGHLVDLRDMTVVITPEKREILLEELYDWINVVKEFTLRDITSLHGS
jgi:hypothetical protein